MTRRSLWQAATRFRFESWPSAKPDRSCVREAAAWAEQQDSDSLVVLYKGRLAHASYFNDQTAGVGIQHPLAHQGPDFDNGGPRHRRRLLGVGRSAGGGFPPEWDTDERRGIAVATSSTCRGAGGDLRLLSGLGAPGAHHGNGHRYANLDVGIYAPPGTASSHANPNSRSPGSWWSALGQALCDSCRKSSGRRWGCATACFSWTGRRHGAYRCCMWTAIEDWARNRPGPDAERLLRGPTGDSGRLGG